MEIDSSLANLNQNFKNIIAKITNLISFWERYRLSLPGRVSIAKTFLVSQLNYLGCFLLPCEDDLKKIQMLINNYIRKNLKISDERIERVPELGGAGFFNLKNFLIAQQCTWINRAYKLQADNWRYDLKFASPNYNILNIRKGDIDNNLHPILRGITESYETFLGAFSKKNANFKDVPVFENKAFPLRPATIETLNKSFFGENFFHQNELKIRLLTIANCMVENRMKTLAEFHTDNFPLTPALWFKLCGVVSFWRRVFGVRGPDSTTLENFFEKTKKGSKKFRKIITDEKCASVVVARTTNANTFFQLTETTCKDDFCGKWIGAWNVNSLPNDFKTFQFNCRNNTLPLNNRLSKFIKEISPLCTFCKIADPQTENRDGYKHCFFECRSVSDILFVLNQKLKTDLDILDTDFRTLYWYGYNDDFTDHQLSYLIFFDSFRYVLYKFRLRHILPDYVTAERELLYFLKKLFYCNRKLKNKFFENPLLAIFLQAIG
jgi:hypothetical protein